MRMSLKNNWWKFVSILKAILRGMESWIHKESGITAQGTYVQGCLIVYVPLLLLIEVRYCH